VAFACLTALQGASLFFLGVDHRTATISLAAQTCECLIAVLCAARAAFRSRRVGRVFWILIASSLAAWMIANGMNFISECARPVFAPLTITLVYRLYGLPIAFALCLREDLTEKFDFEDALAMLQVAVLAIISYVGLLYVPSRQMEVHDLRVLHLMGVSNAENLLLLLIAVIRYRLAGSQDFRNVLRRILLLLSAYAFAAAIGNMLEVYAPRSAAWFDLVWSSFYLLATMLVILPVPQSTGIRQRSTTHASSLIAANVITGALITIVVLVDEDLDSVWHLLSEVAIASAFLSYGLRLSLSQLRQKKAIEALDRSEQEYRELFAKNPYPMWVYDPETYRFLDVNDAMTKLYGYGAEECLSGRVTTMDIRPPEQVPAFVRATDAVRNGGEMRGLAHHKTRDGKSLDVEVISTPRSFQGKKAALILAKDVTERRQLEMQVQQAQKMEAIGLLAGGVAHDFNNLLNVVLGYLQLMPDARTEEMRFQQYASKAIDATRKAAHLVRELLAFGRKQVLWPCTVNLNTVISDVGTVLPGMIGEEVEIHIVLAQDLAAVKLDKSQFQQVILNLVTNARDAMSQGGTIRIATENVSIEPATAMASELKPGKYVQVTISDNGSGMDESTRARVFEPFFTTKTTGSGLGLSTVYGIVEQSGGHIRVVSELGKGSTFEIYFPQSTAAARPQIPAHPSSRAPSRAARLMLVEDEQSLREANAEYLRRAGFSVTVAGDGLEALDVLKKHEGSFDLLITDVVMPRMGGLELAAAALALVPSLKVLFVSGYVDGREQATASFPGSAKLEKPCTFADLKENIDALLQDAKSRAASASTSNP
jgi:PAS domain S-box-containing protein